MKREKLRKDSLYKQGNHRTTCIPSEQRPQNVLVASEAADTESNTFSTSTNNVGLRPGVRAVPLSIIYNTIEQHSHETDVAEWPLATPGSATNTKLRRRSGQALTHAHSPARAHVTGGAAGWLAPLNNGSDAAAVSLSALRHYPSALLILYSLSISISLSRPTRTSDLALAHALHRCATISTAVVLLPVLLQFCES